MSAPTVRVEGVCVAYDGEPALHDVSFTVHPGTLLAVTGPSGAGKSSLLWAICGAQPLAAGTVHLGDQPVTGHEEALRLGVALVPQGNGLATMLSAEENVVVPLLAAGVPAGEAWEQAGAALESTGLGESGRHLVEELSGGQQQRVAVARALAQRAAVILADEPTSDVDAGNRERVVALLRAEARRGAVVIMSTHDPEAAAASDAELALHEGVMTVVRAPR
ncbi:MAG: ATP-binding cassette domain-containing protein [Oryzihumus sp.]|jgi:putative ABC transport system ATP-binding protein